MDDFASHIDALQRVGVTSCVFMTECASTQDVARDLLQAGCKPFTVVVADKQSQARGTHGRMWIDQATAGIATSVIVAVPPRAGYAPWLTAAAAIACVQALRPVVELPPRLKWPNDVLLDQTKVAGVLTEQPSGHPFAIIGLGLNVTRAPDDVRIPATAVAYWSSHRPDRGALWESWLTELFYLVNLLYRGRVDVIREAWRLSLDSVGRRIELTFDGRLVEGVATAVDSRGALIVRLDTGGTIRLQPGAAVTVTHRGERLDPKELRERSRRLSDRRS
ncbi:MAG: biotin--[acetyl-CoA-carboxylase] ligase [Chloroflexi bacterium]|nr:biotin--[acetyl-CoA-carboxylase] ligase [Chloroflexota bacterium]